MCQGYKTKIPVLTKTESAALDKKIENPQATVKCPRCGTDLERQVFCNSIIVKCPTAGCIAKSLRGI